MRESYIKMRNAQILDNNWLWQYYKQNGGVVNDPEDFIDLFLNEQTTINMGGQLFVQKHPRDLSRFFSDMDKKFELITLWDKEGNFLKVVA